MFLGPRYAPTTLRLWRCRKNLPLSAREFPLIFDWSPDCRAVLDSARDISKIPGHHEIVTLPHLFFALASHIHGMPTDRVLQLAATVMPPWHGVYLSRGGQTPRLKLALVRAITVAQSDDRLVTPRDMWEGLPHGDPETYSHLVELFELES